jgi:hypothetical protein
MFLTGFHLYSNTAVFVTLLCKLDYMSFSSLNCELFDDGEKNPIN